jgi:hypothetical protein
VCSPRWRHSALRKALAWGFGLGRKYAEHERVTAMQTVFIVQLSP